VMDMAASVINLIAVRWALQPVDHDHRFGHGKAEALAGLAQAAFIAGSALFLFLSALDRIWSPVPVTSPEIGMGMMLVSMLATGALVLYQYSVIRKTQSLAIQGDSAHYVGDLASNAIVILALFLTTLNTPFSLYFDPLCGLILALWISKSAWEIGKESVRHLMDEELPEDERKRIIALARANPHCLGLHDLRTRQSGPVRFIQLHLELADDLDLVTAHNIGEELEEAILAEFPYSEVIVHLDPLSVIPHDKRNSVLDPEVPSAYHNL
jgi:ferrous-iron efflux pump FieF